MENKEFLEKLVGINPALECLKFLYHRILRDDYRGTHKLQHYRWSAKYIKLVLKNLQIHCDKNGFLYHRMGFINRYTKDKTRCDIGKTYRNYRFVSLTKSGLDFLNV